MRKLVSSDSKHPAHEVITPTGGQYKCKRMCVCVKGTDVRSAGKILIYENDLVYA